MATQPPLELDGREESAVERESLDRRLRRCGVAVAERELRTALTALDDLTPAQRRIVVRMAGRIAAGVLAPARDAAAEGDDRAVSRLFDPERIRDRR